MNLSTAIKSIQDIMRRDDGVDGDAQRIGQLTWMLFLKVLDRREEEWEHTAQEREYTYISPLPEPCRWRNWATFENGKPKTPADKLISFVNDQLFPALKSIDTHENPMRKVIRQVFEDSNNYMKSGTLMLGVIEKLDDAVDFQDFTTLRQLGEIYEQILNDLRSAGNAGEFYTPRAITQVMVELINPRLAKHERVMDPAAGTGGFLTATITYLRSQSTKPSIVEDDQVIEQSIVGFEKKQLPHLLCTTNLLLHGIDIPSQVDRLNTLGRSWEDWNKSNAVDCVITNPPFGGLEDSGVGSDYPDDLRTRETADMFIVLIVQKLLKENGRCAVVLPDGFLFGEGVKSRIKKMLMDVCNLHTIVRLPNGVFAPYTSIKTNLLFFTKGKPTETIWFYEHPYPAGQKSYSRTRPIRIQEFDAEKAWWGREEGGFVDREENEIAWKVDFKKKKTEAEAQARLYWDNAEELRQQVAEREIRARNLRQSLRDLEVPEDRRIMEEQITILREETERLRIQARESQAAGDRLFWPIYNLDIKNPNHPQEEVQDPDILLERYKQLLGDIDETQGQLMNELGAALAHHFGQEDA